MEASSAAAAKSFKRKQDDMNILVQNDYTNFSSPQEVKQRRRITARTETQTTPSTAMTITASPGSKIRKNVREKLYYENMYNLNKKFAEWAKSEEEKICSQIENNNNDNGTIDKNFSRTTFYYDNVSLYIQKAVEIRRKYYPATRDVLTFGQGESGQLGHPYIGADLDCNQPRCVMLFRNAAIDEIECGGVHSIAVSGNDGKVFTFGSNDEGQLGNVDLATNLEYTPTEVHGFIPSAQEVAKGLEKVATWKDVEAELGERLNKDPKHKLDSKYEESIIAVAAGDAHNLCLSSSGRVYFFGAYKDSDNKKFKDDTPKDDPREYKPLTEAERRERESHDDDDTVGSDDKGNHDEVVGSEEVVRGMPKKAPIGTQEWPIHVNNIDGQVVKIACGGSFNAVIVAKKDENTGVTTKTCWTWGISESGELSRELSKPIINKNHVEQPDEPKLARYNLDVIHKEYLVPRPVQWAVGNGNDRKVEAVCCGAYHLLVVSKDVVSGTTSVHSCGLNSYGQLGLGKKMAVRKTSMGEVYDEYPNISKLTEIESLRGKNIIQVAAGNHHSLVLEANGNLYGFGRGDSGQLGNTDTRPGTKHHSADPVPIYLNDGKSNPSIAQIACGENQNLVLTTGGDVYTWGYGDTGALGHGIKFDKNGCSLQDSDEYKPCKLDVTKMINEKRVKKGKTPMTAIVHHVTGGAQHSALVCSLLE